MSSLSQVTIFVQREIRNLRYKTKMNQRTEFRKFVVQCVLLCLSYLWCIFWKEKKNKKGTKIKSLNFAESNAHQKNKCAWQLWDIEFFFVCFSLKYACVPLQVLLIFKIQLNHTLEKATGGGGGGTHMLRHTGMCHPNGLLFHQKSLDMGPISVKKILRRGSNFTKIAKILYKQPLLG